MKPLMAINSFLPTDVLKVRTTQLILSLPIFYDFWTKLPPRMERTFRHRTVPSTKLEPV
jgi:hypothetical protein